MPPSLWLLVDIAGHVIKNNNATHTYWLFTWLLLLYIILAVVALYSVVSLYCYNGTLKKSNNRTIARLRANMGCQPSQVNICTRIDQSFLIGRTSTFWLILFYIYIRDTALTALIDILTTLYINIRYSL